MRRDDEREQHVDDEGFLTKQEVALLVRVHVRTVERAIARGELRATHIGRRVRIHRDWVQLWLSVAVLLVVYS